MHATIIMEGRLVTDPEIKSGKNGDYCTFRFVVNTKYGKPHRRAPVRYARSRRFQVAMTMTTSPSDLDIHIWAVSVVNACSPFCFVHSKIYIRKD